MEKGPFTSLAGLPAFYVITEIEKDIPGFNSKDRGTIWYIYCNDRYFTICSSLFDVTPARQPYHEEQNQIFENFLKSIKNTGELKPGNTDGGGGFSPEGENGGSSGGGCDTTGGLFSILALAVFYALRRNRV